jgi:hypothetical protein
MKKRRAELRQLYKYLMRRPCDSRDWRTLNGGGGRSSRTVIEKLSSSELGFSLSWLWVRMIFTPTLGASSCQSRQKAPTHVYSCEYRTRQISFMNFSFLCSDASLVVFVRSEQKFSLHHTRCATDIATGITCFASYGAKFYF